MEDAFFFKKVEYSELKFGDECRYKYRLGFRSYEGVFALR